MCSLCGTNKKGVYYELVSLVGFLGSADVTSQNNSTVCGIKIEFILMLA